MKETTLCSHACLCQVLAAGHCEAHPSEWHFASLPNPEEPSVATPGTSKDKVKKARLGRVGTRLMMQGLLIDLPVFDLCGGQGIPRNWAPNLSVWKLKGESGRPVNYMLLFNSLSTAGGGTIIILPRKEERQTQNNCTENVL